MSINETHKEYRRDVPGADTVVLFIHGICSSPNYYREFFPHVPETWAIRAVLLDGHGGTVLEFAQTSMEKWKQQITDVLDQLAEKYPSIIIVGHSMGTLFAIEQSIRIPDKIKLLFLLAVPLKALVKPSASNEAIRIALNIRPHDNPSIESIKEDYSMEPDRKIWRYIGWLPRYRELMQEMRATRTRVTHITVPCYVYQSRHDDAVSPKSSDYLIANPTIHLEYLEHSGHNYYTPEDEAYLLGEFERLCMLHA
ncbi:MAG TPA: alpha/beta fold hydrolase [Clostridia bacterium]|nr:alpha/beta fold hydrolase [Clostridia bacterium]